MKETVKSLTKKHKKKAIGSGILATIVTVMTFWTQIYPIVCPMLNLGHQEVCIKLGVAASKLGPVLDKSKLDEGVTVDDGGTNE